MATKLCRMAKVIIFLVIVVIMLQSLLVLLTPKWTEDRWDSVKSYVSYYELDDDSVEVLLVGSSSMASAISPFELYKDYGILSYNLGFVSQPPIGNYFWIKEAMKKHDLKAVVVEVKPVGKIESKIESGARKSYDTMQWGLNKLQYGYEYCMASKAEAEAKMASGENGQDVESADLFEYVFPLSLYHNRWSDLNEEDFEFWAKDDSSRNLARGFTMITGRSNKNYNGKTMDYEGELPEYNATNTQYLIKIIEMCRENNIALTLMKAPDTAWGKQPSAYVQKIADEYDVPFIDFNRTELLDEINYNFHDDCGDSIHTNIEGALKLTDYLGRHLKNTVKLKDYRQDKEWSARLDREYEVYKCLYEDASLIMEDNLDEYLEKINSDRYTYCFAASQAEVSGFTGEQLDKLEAVGIDEDFIKKCTTDKNIMLMVQNGSKKIMSDDVADEAGNSTTISKEGVINGNTSYSFSVSDGKFNVSIGSFKKTITVPEKIGLVIYDNVTGQVADAAVFDLKDGKRIVNHK